jgi:hypothetical protein
MDPKTKRWRAGVAERLIVSLAVTQPLFDATAVVQ